MSVAITGSGRCGTKWLTAMLNTSKTWTVKHEPSPRASDDIDACNKRMSQPKYAEVDCKLIDVFSEVQSHRKAVIVRHPRDVYLSYVNWNLDKDKEPTRSFARLNRVWIQLMDACQRDAFPIWFDRMTTDKDYLHVVAKELGIHDCTFDHFDEKINNVMPTYTSWDAVPDRIRACAFIPERFVEEFDL